MSRRAPVYGVVLVSQLVGMVIALVIAILTGETFPATSDLALAVVGGVLGAMGITALYQGLAVGRMGVIAPVTGILAAAVPVAAGIVFDGLPAPLVLVGIAVALVAVLLVTRVKDDGGGRSGLELALVAGVAIGLFGVVISRLHEGSVFGPLTVIRAVEALSVVVVILVTRAAWRPPRSLLPPMVGIGVADMAGNSLYILAVQAGTLAVAAVTSSLYPVMTVLLAATVLHERITRSHAAGIALAAIAIALIGLGSA
jgi:drug/metabolite transporter (DMT)-like permease